MMNLNMTKIRVILLLVLCLNVFSALVYAQTAQPTSEPTSEPTLEPTESTEPTAEITPTSTDDQCPELVRNALDLTEQRCEQIGDNEVCYGHSTLQAAARPGLDLQNFTFDQPGDIEDVIKLQSLSLSPMDTLLQEWGVILMRVRGELETVTQGALTVVVFGNTELSTPSVLLEVTVAANANLREAPNTTSRVVGVISANTVFRVIGRTVDGQWLRARFENEVGDLRVGWISAALVTVTTEEDLSTLQIINPDGTETTPTRLGPGQAFFFQSGVDDAPCEAAPQSGMLIQTPEGQASVTLWIDEVVIEVSGTAFLQAQPDGELEVKQLDGYSTVTAEGETRTAIEGTQISVPLDKDLGTAGAPTEPVPYDLRDLDNLPTTLLDEQIVIADPLAIGDGIPASGLWRFTWGGSVFTCPDGTAVGFESSGVPSGLSVTNGGQIIRYGGGNYNRIASGTYTRSYIDENGNLYQDTLTIEALDRITGLSVIDFSARACTLNVPFTLRLVGLGS